MHSAQKEQIYFQLNRFISLLFYQLCRNEIAESEREWTQAVILVHSTELHPVFTKTRWKSLKHSTTKYNSHCSWNLQELRYSCWKNLFQHTHTHSSRTPIKKSVQPNYYKKWKVKRLHLIEDTKICLKPVGKIARTVAAPHTKLLEPNQEQALCDFWNLWRTNANPL